MNLSVTLGGHIYAVGGKSAGDMGPTEQYDPVANTWRTLGDLGFQFYNGAVAVLNGQIWACGGCKCTRECPILDTSTNTWIPAATMSEPMQDVLNSELPQLRNSIWLLSIQSELLHDYTE